MRFILSILLASSVASAAPTPVASFGANPGALNMYEYIPTNLPAGAPLVVVMHGCTMTAASMASAGWNTLADANGFAVVYPEQTSANNIEACFDWFGAADLARGQGENQSIISMIDTEIATHHSDPARVYVTGLSAGAAYAAVMLATWPDRFAAGSIMAGLPYRCAADVSGAFSCQNPGVAKSPTAWGDLVRAASSATAFPRVQIWQGASDTTVAPANAAELVKQWTNVHGADQTPNTDEMIGAARHQAFADGAVELYTITGMNHAIAIGGEGCPATRAMYFDDRGICSTVRAAAFFGVLGGASAGGDAGVAGGGDDTADHPAGGFGCDAGGGSGGGLAIAICFGMAAATRRRMRIALPFVVLALASHSALASQTEVTMFGSNPGGLKMYEHIPAGLPAGAPLVVVLHGCTQTAASMETAGWDALADQYKFAVAYAQQTSANNPVECFNWAGNYGNTADLQRGMGENESIIQMVDAEIATHHVDTHKVFVVGFSAGAGFAAVMLATWPDRFAAGAIMSGLPYRCATTVAGAYQCQSPGTTKAAAAWGDLVRGASTMTAFPRVQIWQGASDTTVAPMNEDELVKQWTNVWATDQTADETETIGSATRNAYKVGGTIVVESYKVAGMTHAIAVGADPSGACPSTTAQFFEDHGICATLRAARFFGLTGSISGGGGGADTAPPVVAFQSPSSGDTVSGAVTVVVAASDNVGVASVKLAVDGATIGTSTAAPFQFAWTASGAGAHQLVATATDAAGNAAMATASVTVPGDGTGGGGGGGGGGGSNGAQPGGTQDLPSCSLNAGRGGGGWLAVGVALAFALRRRR